MFVEQEAGASSDKRIEPDGKAFDRALQSEGKLALQRGGKRRRWLQFSRHRPGFQL